MKKKMVCLGNVSDLLYVSRFKKENNMKTKVTMTAKVKMTMDMETAEGLRILLGATSRATSLKHGMTEAMAAKVEGVYYKLIEGGVE